MIDATAVSVSEVLIFIRCREAARELIGVGAAVARADWLAVNSMLVDPTHEFLPSVALTPIVLFPDAVLSKSQLFHCDSFCVSSCSAE
jgi:hypothetical protein